MRIIIIGAGEVGFHLAGVLSREGQDVSIIDVDEIKCQRARDQLDVMVIQGNGASAESLRQAGTEGAHMLIAVSSSDEINITACLMARKFGVKVKVARVRNPDISGPDPFLSPQELGIDMAINPEKTTAEEIIWLIKQAAATDVVEFAGGEIQAVGLRLDVSAPILNKSMREVTEIYPNITFRIIAIARNGETLIPGGDTHLRQNDQIFFIAKRDDVHQVLTLAGRADERPVDSVMILGGGKIGRLVAQALEQEKIPNIKLIEGDRDKSEMVAETLQNTLVIHGDGTDIDLLGTEGIIDMDAYIAVTQDEETNIISCLLAKHLGVHKTIALLARSAYHPLAQSIGLDAAVDKRLIIADAILRYVRRGHVLSVCTLKGIDAEILELEVEVGAHAAGPRLSKLKFPKDAIIGAVLRGGEVFVPVGDSVIEPGDKVIVFALPGAIKSVEKLFT